MDKHEICVRVGEKDYTSYIKVRDHEFVGDEPESLGGYNKGPNPYEYLLAALGSCVTMTVRMYANHKQWPLDEVIVHLSHAKDYAEDCVDCDNASAKIDKIMKRIEFRGDLSPEQIKRLHDISNKCPVYKTLLSEIKIDSELLEGADC